MTNQTDTQIPEAITAAATAMLQPYAPGLTPEALATAITFQPEEQQEKLLSRKEAAEALHCSLPSIDRSLRDGTLNRIRVRGRSFIRQSQVLAIINGGGE